MQRAGLFASIALALAVALAACAPAPKPAAPNPDGAPAQPAAGEAAAPAGGAGGGAADASKGLPEEAPLSPIPELKIALGADLVTTSPFFAFPVTDKNIIKHMIPGLTRIDENGQVAPMLAERWELIAPDTWQFRIRRNVKFHNGEPLTADAFKTTYEVMFAPETKASQTSAFRVIKDVQVVDDYTLNVVTAQPDPILPKTLSDLHILAPQYLRERGFEYAGAHPVGAGPYKFVEWVKGDHLTMEANPDYWGGVPAIKRLVFRPIVEDGARVAALQAGEVDLAYNVPFEMARQIDSSRRASTRSVLTSTVYLLGLNTLYPDWPTAKKEVRQAISYAIDREGIIRTIMGGLGAPLATLFHTTSFGRDPDLKPRVQDLAKAKALLAQAGYPDGFHINMVASQGRWPKDREVAQAIASQLGAVGITVDLEVLEYTNFTQQVHSKQRPMALWGWSDTEADPNTMLLRLYTCQDMGSPWSLNCLPELDGIVKAQQFEIDPQKREALLRRAQEIMYDEEPNVALFQMGQIRGVSSKAADWYRLRADEGIWLFHPTR